MCELRIWYIGTLIRGLFQCAWSTVWPSVCHRVTAPFTSIRPFTGGARWRPTDHPGTRKPPRTAAVLLNDAQLKQLQLQIDISLMLIWRYLENLASVRLPFTHVDDKLTCVKERTTEKCEQNTPWQHDFTVLQYLFIDKSVQNSGLVCRYWLPHSCNRCPKPQSSARWFLWVLLAHGQSHVVWMFDPLPTIQMVR